MQWERDREREREGKGWLAGWLAGALPSYANAFFTSLSARFFTSPPPPSPIRQGLGRVLWDWVNPSDGWTWARWRGWRWTLGDSIRLNSFRLLLSSLVSVSCLFNRVCCFIYIFFLLRVVTRRYRQYLSWLKLIKYSNGKYIYMCIYIYFIRIVKIYSECMDENNELKVSSRFYSDISL